MSSTEPAVVLADFELGQEDGEQGTSRVAVVITLSRPDRLNAIDWEMLRELDAVLDGLAHRQGSLLRAPHRCGPGLQRRR